MRFRANRSRWNVLETATTTTTGIQLKGLSCRAEATFKRTKDEAEKVRRVQGGGVSFCVVVVVVMYAEKSDSSGAHCDKIFKAGHVSRDVTSGLSAVTTNPT